MALDITVAPGEIAAGVDDNGNVMIAGIDRMTGVNVTILIDSAHWKEVYSKMGRLKGIGIYKANRIIEVQNDN